MKAIKRTPVPLPASNLTANQKKAPPRPQLSQEVLNSDDDSSNGNESTPQAKTSTKPKTTIAIHAPNGAVKRPANQPKEKSAVKAVSKSRSAPNQPVQESGEESSGSDASDDSHLPTKNGQERNISSDSSSDSSDDGSEEGTAAQTSRTGTQEKVVRTSQAQSHTVEFRQAEPYVPPRGFGPIPLNDRITSKAASIFDDLDGKQVWHIKAPAGISFKELHTLSLEEAFGGQTILNHKGTDYGFLQTEKSEHTPREVLVPEKSSLKAVPARISQTLHLQAIVRLPELSDKQADTNTGSEAAASITRSTIRTPRAQVNGLKMRFLPVGFHGDAAGTIGDSDNEMETPTETAGLGMPNGLNLPSRRKEKRKHADVNGSETIEAPAKKSKKHRSIEDVKRKEERRAKKEKKRARDAAGAEL
ncbi:hypothetical protein IAQ61_010145 [Plenodomus lingam]|uniref:Uncharacterized protein n=1 Tax=Leptosphaeria maculans (strain JN3 / isolate v23.1.3 / race Av1-4-5-6-7-8) TaxID=985895 RepID=E5A327_LEPMJ|nr:hypothetical protein LEMA_P094490.1 [Plenodomus lingam JN3]KAH9861944.1 hypothetical protein IAQ61_010145 [Plenodomus lingam]CBX98040.1 hypothetical protein LEMA_P094490.1 [Plenodomus lingam JN3]